ncbi:succinoglycan biosynthesis protein exoi [Mesorhizobium hungaricum]|jgi:endonuclease YncB( thermonuclease family)|uniref:Succinoglycan biosynthesis protein exoi n=1 Tax=Mesorhizobium hungaricum TaxID=1566387 RepID=A0A1C2E320_9HYPH|nr:MULTISPECIES: succinoglycan biosynthesis protein exoi [Mesorhizobium]MBN9235715.1 thermonuclease family protein [Mesorhizobium sp.]MDQ0332946.1 endonuclease YncB(thermonuclease family) [Mesorhizobium sp. YL-MeA3-2017]OCX21388.1 succinoglycan biosynthesis protein exoi [Mesorhizobium hungaricum]
MRALAVLVAASISAPVAAAPAGYFDLLPGVALESGDSWTDAGTRYHLYGVQACLRGTSYTDRSGKSDDCGEASLAVLAAFIADTRPTCAPVATITNVTHVVCYASVGVDRLDLGNLMITSGYAFAALRPDGLPYSPAYAVAEQVAREKHAGLWQFKDVQSPAILLGRAAAGGSTGR